MENSSIQQRSEKGEKRSIPGHLRMDFRRTNLLPLIRLFKTSRKPRSVNGDECRFCIGIRKLAVFREAVKPRLVGGDRSHGATFFTTAFEDEE
jgi:hypothetical protein